MKDVHDHRENENRCDINNIIESGVAPTGANQEILKTREGTTCDAVADYNAEALTVLEDHYESSLRGWGNISCTTAE